jgi:hypothetical protein
LIGILLWVGLAGRLAVSGPRIGRTCGERKAKKDSCGSHISSSVLLAALQTPSLVDAAGSRSA